jgi:hypothetical protein
MNFVVFPYFRQFPVELNRRHSMAQDPDFQNPLGGPLEGVKVVAICPGYISTRFYSSVDLDYANTV